MQARTQKRWMEKLSLWMLTIPFLVTGCLNWRDSSSQQTIWQNSPTVGLLNGLYDGISSVDEIRPYGDFGLGTWNRLNGEGLIIDGAFYAIHADGTAHVMPDEATMPWVSITWFKPDRDIALPAGLSMENISAEIDPVLPTVNTYYAVRIEGEFEVVQTRSLPAQKKPYPPFCEVEKTEPKFLFEKVRGTMVGFRSPPFTTNMSVPNWHLHFLNEERSGGGHVLSFKLLSGTMSIDRVNEVSVVMPSNPAYDKANLDSIITCN